jgi:hypothetical protein
MLHKEKLPLLVLLAILSFGAFSQTVHAADDENCLMCHKYRKMGWVTEEGTMKYFYVVPSIFFKTVHSRVPCRDCHHFIKELPHAEVKEGVTCDTQCHIINPATNERFSHKPIMDAYKKSVHGRDKLPTGEVSELDKDKPYCIYCHTNPKYNPYEETPASEITGRCNVCHENEQFVTHWYMHTSRRIKEVRRLPEEAVEICSSCHEREKMLERHKELKHEIQKKEMGRKFLFAAESYKESFHYKTLKFGLEEAPHCLSCHADQENYYLSVHDIKNSRDPESPIHPNNRVRTCKGCHYHGKADKNFAKVDPHPSARIEDNPFIHYASIVYNIIAYTAFFGLVGLKAVETFGRKRDGVHWFIRNGTTWRRNKRGW